MSAVLVTIPTRELKIKLSHDETCVLFACYAKCDYSDLFGTV